MKIILSPAKKMQYEEIIPYRGMPVFINEAKQLTEVLKTLNFAQLQEVWKCSDRLVKENMERLSVWSDTEGLSPAVFSYIGLAFQHLSPGSMTEEQMDYLQEHLRILSGLYGVLKPFDGIREYRLEMQADLSAGGSHGLYDFWKDRIFQELVREDDEILDLASKEYSRCVRDWLKPGIRYTECVFAEEKNGRILTKGTMAKMARGTMVRWLAENAVSRTDEIRAFREGWSYSETYSSEDRIVFLKDN